MPRAAPCWRSSRARPGTAPPRHSEVPGRRYRASSGASTASICGSRSRLACSDGPTPMTEPEKLIVSWSDLDALVEQMAGQVGSEYDVVLTITRGALVP